MKSIALHPSKGLMFWIFYHPNGNLIEQAWMSGENRKTVVSSIGQWPISLSIDHAMERLYWLNGYSGKIETVRTDGSDRFIPVKALSSKIYAMDVFEGLAYLTDQGSNVIKVVDAFSSKQKEHKSIRMSRPGPIKVSHVMRQPRDYLTKACSKKCMYLCVSTPTGSQCLCPKGYAMTGNPNCEGPYVLNIPTTTQRTTTKKTTVKTKTTKRTTQKAAQKTKDSVLFTTAVPTNSTICPLPCKNQGSCISVMNTIQCSCPVGYSGKLCENYNISTPTKTRKTQANGDEAEGSSFAWVGGLVFTIVVLVVLAAVGGCYMRYKRNNASFLSTIKYLHAKSGKGKENDRTELIPEISFSNPGFQEEIDQEAEAFQEWWKKLLTRSRRSVDSAFQGSHPSSESSEDAEKPEDSDPRQADTDTLLLLN